MDTKVNFMEMMADENKHDDGPAVQDRKPRAETAPALPPDHENPLEDPGFFDELSCMARQRRQISDFEISSKIKQQRSSRTSENADPDCSCKLKMDGTVQSRKCPKHGDSEEFKWCYQRLVDHIQSAPSSSLVREMSTIGLIIKFLFTHRKVNAVHWINKSLKNRLSDPDIAQAIVVMEKNIIGDVLNRAQIGEVIRLFGKLESQVEKIQEFDALNATVMKNLAKFAKKIQDSQDILKRDLETCEKSLDYILPAGRGKELSDKLNKVAALEPRKEEIGNLQHPFETGVGKVGSMQCKKVFPSNQRPVLVDMKLVQQNQESSVHARPVIVKRGDNLQQDVACLSAFHIMNMLWKKQNIGINDACVQARTYGCTAIGSNLGIVEFITKCVSLNDYKGKVVEELRSSAQMNNLVCTAAGSYIACYVLGVRDRHSDNILVDLTSHDLFHIDFGYILGNSVPLDTFVFAIPMQLKKIMDKEFKWDLFVSTCVRAFEVLRQNEETLRETLVLLFSGVATREEVEAHLRKSLLLDRQPHNAATEIRRLLQAAPKSLRTALKNKVHNIAQSVKA